MAATELTEPKAPAEVRHELLPCEIYQAWQAAREDAHEAFGAWCASPSGRKAEAYATYRAAVDRENAAADRWLAV